MDCTKTDILERATAELVDALMSGGVPSLLLKGPVFSRWLYDDGVPRSYNDIDLLVQEERRWLAEQQLRELGFRLAPMSRRDWEAAPHAIGWERATVEVDLHWTLWAAEAAPATVWHALRADAQELSVGGANVPSVGPRARAMLVAVHAARHRSPSQPVAHAKSAEDLRRALERCSLDEWRAAAELADRLGLLDAIAVGLRSLPQGEVVAARLELPESARSMILLSGVPPPTAEWFLRAFQAHGVRAKLWLLAREIVPSVEFIRSASPRLAARGRVGLLIAYVIRPFIRAARAPRGFTAALRATRKGRR